ncbi:type I polyketide synthase [Streptomyces sp. SID13726]|uniref:type I polyketide synthase n=1 Tax=Streptomyces sp. SID13726 TaxID=2706058 RepID=UPI0013BAB023|nr:type I polyketide synthase [Streptomyces sp. SID13726]NEA98888.1 alpha/beta fold hydrolase [Streptomyces sp. SID13726]
MSDTPENEFAETRFSENDIAVIGLAARFPGSETVEEFWENVAAGRESVRPVGEEEFLQAGGDPADLADPSLVRRASVIEGIDLFDAGFFGYSPAEAAIVDPQQRLLLECAYLALESSGYAADQGEGAVGVYAGAGDSRYYASHVYPRFAGQPGSVELVHTTAANSLGTLATRVSYELGLTGPSLSLQTACSTGLVAIHTACQDLLNHACDMALAGAVSVNPSAKLGYRHVPGGVFSPDGSCRPFDADAGGTVPGDGVGVVVLKRLADALADGDRIRAVVKGSAVNNDGRRKVGFSAPSTEGQCEAILMAQALAGVDADSIGYLEAHGTGTSLGDPIEVEALTRVFRESSDRRQFCALGSVKSNIGHVGAAAGLAGFIKAVLVLEHRQIPPVAHFRRPNPLIDLAGSPFRVPTGLEEWPAGSGPRRAGVSAFGIGGTNAHVVLEEAPDRPVRVDGDPGARWQVLPLSARTPGALPGQCDALARHLSDHPGADLAAVSHTLRTRRPAMAFRAAVVAEHGRDAVELLGRPLSDTPSGGAERPPRVAFLLPGGGVHYPGMGAELYEECAPYRAVVDRCAGILRPVLGRDLREVLFGAGTADSDVPGLLSVVVTEYALATVLMERGVRPDALIGHSLGEYTAACLAGVMDLEDMLLLVAERGRLMVTTRGATVSVALGEAEVRPLLTGGLSLSVVNSPEACTVGGDEAAVAELERRLTAEEIPHRRLALSVAAHSHLLDPILGDFAEAVRGVTLRPPRLPYVTSTTGTWATDEQATGVRHWVDQLRGTVRFAEGITALWERGEPLLVEVGPGDTLSKLARACLPESAPGTVVTMRHARSERSDVQVFTEALARLWTAGVPADLAPLSGARENGPGTPLPGYAFDRRSHWIDPPRLSVAYGGLPSARDTTDAPETVAAPVARALAPRPHLRTAYTAPAGDLEHAVTEQWQEVLGVEPIGVRDNFFDLGGDSMRAVILAGRLRKAGVLDVPGSAVLAAPTVAGLLERAGRRGGGRDAFAPILPLRTEGDRRPLFCLHPGGGIGWRYAGLLAHLGERQPVHAVQARGLDGVAPPAADPKDMVESYLELVREIQPTGPYRLLGWSYGGMVAHAMATALQEAGERVELLALLDSPLLHLHPPSPEVGERQVVALLSRLTGVHLPQDAPPNVADLLELLDSSGPAAASEVTAAEAADIARVMRNNLRIAPEFSPGVFRGDVLFFTAVGGAGARISDDPSDAQDKAEEWSAYVDGSIEDHEVPCGHYEMTEPEPMALIGEVVAAALAATEG